MKPVPGHYIGAGILCLFFFLVFAIAFAFNNTSAVLIIAGEDSVGSWMSGVLLVVSSTVTAVVASKKGWYPWLLFTAFFLLLAIDENFMIHEAIKRKLVFTTFEKTNHPVYWIGELPAILGACIGAAVAWIMWKRVDGSLRWLILTGVIFGTASVTIDVLTIGVLWEDSFKLIAELAVACALVCHLQKQ